MALNNYYSDSSISEEQIAEQELVKEVLLGNLTGIFGIPYQFHGDVDRRIPGTEIGRKYAEKIVSKMPLLFLTPCKQVFMEHFTGDDKETVLSALVDGIEHEVNVSSTGKYYTTKFDYNEYYKYVDQMCQGLATFLNIGNIKLGISNSVDTLSSMSWYNVKNTAFNDYFAASNSVVMYVDGLVSMDESFSNNTTESSLASKINGYSDMANEIKFLLGEDSALGALYETGQEFTETLGDSLSGLAGNLAGGMLSDLSDRGVNTVISGGKLIFPKIWSDSSFNRSYSFTIKLRSPDHDSLSIFLNILVPYIHLLCLVLPKAHNDDPNGYLSPFLVKAYCKGMFNIDMGIISDMSVTRGAECQWNDDGLPTQIDINITIEDLYSSLFMSAGGKTADIVKNTGMMDFLANMAGLNIAEEEIARRERMFVKMIGGSIGRFDNRLYNKFDNAIANLVSRIYR